MPLSVTAVIATAQFIQNCLEPKQQRSMFSRSFWNVHVLFSHILTENEGASFSKSNH